MDTITILGQQIPVALVLVYLQNWLKRQKWFPLLNYESAKMNHLFAIVAAGVATLGVNFSHSGSLVAGGGWTITVPALSVLTVNVWHWVTQYILAKTGYTALASQLNPPTAQQPQAVTEVKKS